MTLFVIFGLSCIQQTDARRNDEPAQVRAGRPTSTHTHTHSCLYLFEELQVDSHGQEVPHGAGAVIHKALLTEHYRLPLRRETEIRLQSTVRTNVRSLYYKHVLYTINTCTVN